MSSCGARSGARARVIGAMKTRFLKFSSGVLRGVKRLSGFITPTPLDAPPSSFPAVMSATSLQSRLSGRLQGRRPPQQVIDHGGCLLVHFSEALLHVPALEIRPKGAHCQRNGSPHPPPFT